MYDMSSHCDSTQLRERGSNDQTIFEVRALTAAERGSVVSSYPGQDSSQPQRSIFVRLL